MRSLIFVSILALGSASTNDKAKCVVDGGEAASDLLDSALFIWGATQRCGNDALKVKCEIDISSAVQSISSMINTILKVVDRCGEDFDADCGRAATRLVKAMAGLSSASGGIKQKCHPNWQQPAAGGAYVGGAVPGSAWMHGASALCVLDVKNTAKNLLKAIKYLVKVDKKCEDKHSRKCTKNTLKVVGALAGIGEYIAASIGDCEAPSEMAHDAECAQESIMLVHHVTKVAEAGVEIGKECGEAPAAPVSAAAPPPIVFHVPPRRYEVEEEDVEPEKQDKKDSYANLALGASLPLAAVVSFAAGKFYAGRQALEAREFLSDNE